MISLCSITEQGRITTDPLSAFVIRASFFLSFVFIEFRIFISECVVCVEWRLSCVCVYCFYMFCYLFYVILAVKDGYRSYVTAVGSARVRFRIQFFFFCV